MTGQNTQSSLAEIDRKLRELQQELSRVVEPVSNDSAAAQQSPSGQPASGPRASPLPALSRPLVATQAPPASPNTGSPKAGGVTDDRLGRIVSDLEAHVAGLQRLRDELRDSIGPKAVAGFTPPSGPSHAGGADPPSPAAAPPTGSAPPGQAAPLLAAGDQAQTFDGHVIVNAGPFVDIGTLGAFERALAYLPQAHDVYVRSFEGNRALIDLRLAGPVHLLDEMRQVLPFSFGVVEVSSRLLTINVDPTLPSGTSQPGPEGASPPVA